MKHLSRKYGTNHHKITKRIVIIIIIIIIIVIIIISISIIISSIITIIQNHYVTRKIPWHLRLTLSLKCQGRS